jgi:localization factor PodJL
MKPGIPWSVKGIGAEAREAAKVAARRSGMTLGEWLNSVILDTSDEPPAYEARQPYRPQAPPRREDAPIRLEDLAQQLARLTQREQDSAPRAYEQPPARPPAIDDDTLQRIAQRIETGERQAIEAFSAVNERLAALGSKISEGARARYPERPEDVPGYQALEGALRNVVDHIETSEKRTRDALKGLQDRLGGMAQRASSADSERVLQQAPAISRLESRLSELASRLERTETTTHQDLPERINAQVDALAARIEEVRAANEDSFQRVESAAAISAQQELRDIEVRIQKLLGETQSSMRLQSASGQDLQRLRGEIESLNQRIDDLKTGSASERDLGALRIAIEQLSTRVAQGPDLRPLADMDRRLADLAQRLEQNSNAQTSRVAPQLAELDRRVFDLDHRLAEAMNRQADPRAAAALERQLGAVSERLGQAEQQIGHLARIESSIGQLYDSVEQSRAWSAQAAEEAANRMAERLLQNQQQMLASLPQQQGPSPELRALEEGLHAVRASAASSDRRNQETLEAVHETLEQIVNKLAEMEMAREQAPPPAAAPAFAPPPAQEWSFAPPPQQQQPALDQRQIDTQMFGIPVGPEPQMFEAPAAPEPQMFPAPAQPAPVTPQFTAPEPDFAPPQPAAPALSDPGSAAVREDFIAAARRAAQAAAQQQAGANPGMFKRTPASTQKSGFSLPFFNRKKSAAPSISARAPTISTSASPGTGKRGTLILAGVVILAAASLIAFKNLGGTGLMPKLQDVEPAAIGDAPAPAETAPAAPASEAAPDAPGAMPPKPRPAELESGMPDPATLDQPEKTSAMEAFTDAILTGALPSKADSSLSSLIAEPGADAGAATEAPPPAAGSEALRQAAASGNAAAQFVVASNYLDGKSVEQDFTKAAAWYQKAAGQGLAPAQYRLATLFERGRGVPQDIAAARLWYERAAEGGNVKAMHNAAVIASSAQDGQPDYARAAKWFTAAAEHGLKDSQYNLAVLHERGLGVKLNMGEALFWYTLAARQDDADAAKKASMLEQSLAPSTIDEVKTRIGSWAARTGDPKANIVAVEDPAWDTKTSAIPDAVPLQAMLSAESAEQEPAAGPGLTQRAQALLIKLGYDIGAADGKMGTRTSNAIRLFELQSGMKVTGTVSDALVEKMAKKIRS